MSHPAQPSQSFNADLIDFDASIDQGAHKRSKTITTENPPKQNGSALRGCGWEAAELTREGRDCRICPSTQTATQPRIGAFPAAALGPCPPALPLCSRNPLCLCEEESSDSSSTQSSTSTRDRALTIAASPIRQALQYRALPVTPERKRLPATTTAGK